MAQKKQIPIELKALSEDGSFEGILAYYNNVDLGGDLIEPGAFKKNIQEKGTRRPLLWQHDQKNPIGSMELDDRADGLYVKGDIAREIPQGNSAYVLLKRKDISGLSIGYDTVKAVKENGVRHLKELRLWEGSVVTLPMNEEATVTSVKRFCDVVDAVESADEISAEQKSITVNDLTMRFSADWKASQAAEAEALTVGSVVSEVKEGRVLSSATKEKMKMAHGHIKSADDIFNALLVDDEADDDSLEDDDTLKSAAAEETKSEPDIDHSAAEILTNIRSLFS